jgi:hypothetical protein
MTGRFSSEKRTGAICIVGWVGAGTGLDGCGKSCPPPESDPRFVLAVASRYTDYDIPTHGWSRQRCMSFPHRLLLLQGPPSLLSSTYTGSCLVEDAEARA